MRLGDHRRTKRAVLMAESIAHEPAGSPCPLRCTDMRRWKPPIVCCSVRM
ncbi:MAG TPA: hypothetical protein VGL94_05795 [Ktedonobacteraceae bacterium]